MEYLLLTSFLLVASGLIFAYANSSYSQALNLGLAKSAVGGIVNAADQTYALGRGSVMFLEIDTPDATQSLRVDNTCKPEFGPGTIFALTGPNAYVGCLEVDPDAECCVGNSRESAEAANCAADGFDPAHAQSYCHDFFSEDAQTLTLKGGYLVLGLTQISGTAEVYRQARVALDMNAQTAAILARPGRHTVKVDNSQANGIVRIGVVGS
jgi:hypothetical protein